MICWFELSTNDIMHSRFKYFVSSLGPSASRSQGGVSGFPVISFYFRDSVAISVAKGLIKSNWVNTADVFQEPLK